MPDVDTYLMGSNATYIHCQHTKHADLDLVFGCGFCNSKKPVHAYLHVREDVLRKMIDANV